MMDDMLVQKHPQLEMLRDQVMRCDEELLIFLKRRIQTSKKIADYVKKNDLDEKIVRDLGDEIFLKSSAKAREMSLKMTYVNELLGLIDDECKKVQKEALEK